MRAHTEIYRCMMPWCARMKQLIEQHGLDEPPKPDFSRALPPLLMETMDVCSPDSESPSVSFRVCTLQTARFASDDFQLNFCTDFLNFLVTAI